MKRKILFLILFLFAIVFTFQSCSDDDNKAVKNVLVTSNRSTGQFYTINLSTGKLSEAFNVTYEGETLYDVRGFVYHPGEDAFYASVHSYSTLGQGNQKGMLYKIDVNTKVATLINNNDGDGGAYDVWDAIVNWAVDADDSLVAVGDFNSDGNGFVKFGTDGGRSLKTMNVSVCCGLGMLYDSETKEALVGNDPNDGEVYIEKFNVQTGASLDDYSFTTFTGFPESFNNVSATSWMPLKGLAVNSEDPEGTVYGILFNDEDESNKTYFVSLNFETLTVKYISTLGISTGDQYNALSFIPNSKL